MKCVVPLAGGDIVHPEHGFRPWFPVDGVPLLSKALNQRAWCHLLSARDYLFVVRQVPGVERLCAWLAQEWPGCMVLTLPAMTAGAMFTAMAGVALLPRDDEAIIIDLADILFATGPSDPAALMTSDVGAVIPCFESNEPCYSYLRFENGTVVEAAEKRVISNHASAGVYAFRDRQLFLEAASYSIAAADRLAHKGIQFICPMANGVIASGARVLAPKVDDVVPVGKFFH